MLSLLKHVPPSLIEVNPSSNINCRRKGNWRKRKGSKEKDDGKGSRETRRLIEGHPFLVPFVYESDINVISRILVERFQLPTSFHPNQARIIFSKGQCVKEVLSDTAPTNSCHLLFIWAWLHFKTLTVDERSLWGIRDMKWSWNLWHQDKLVRINIGWRRK